MCLKKKERKRNKQRKKNPPNSRLILHSAFWGESALLPKAFRTCNSPDDGGQSRCAALSQRQGVSPEVLSGDGGDAAPWWLSQAWSQANPRKLFFLLLLPGSSRKCIGKVTKELGNNANG